MTKIYRWDRDINKLAEIPNPAPPCFQSGRYTYYGSSLEGHYLEKFTRVAKIAAVIIGTITIIPIPLIALTNGYESAGKWIMELKYDTVISGKVSLLEAFRDLIPKCLWTEEMKEIVQETPKASIPVIYKVLKFYSKVKLQGLSEKDYGSVPFPKEYYELLQTSLPKNLKDLLEFCQESVKPNTQNETTLLQTGKQDERDFWYHGSLTTDARFTEVEKGWAKEGFTRPFYYVPLVKKILLTRIDKVYTLTIATRVPNHKAEVQRTKDVIIDFTPFKSSPETCIKAMFAPFPEEQFLQVREKFLSDVADALLYVYDR